MVESHEVLGCISAAAEKSTGLLAGTPVMGGAADFIASALCAGLQRKGDVLIKFGGSIDVLTVSDRPVGHESLYLDYHLIAGLFVPNGCMSSGGTGLNWLANNFLFARPDTLEPIDHHQLDQLADGIAAGSEGVIVLPYFLGEKTPLHHPDARGVISGLSFSHGPGHLWRAFLEAYAYEIRHHIEVFNAAGHATERFTVSDGGSSSAVWMQIVSDVIQRPLQTLTGHPGSCLGAAWTAAVGKAGYSWSQSSSLTGLGAIVKPDPTKSAAYEEGYQSFRELHRRIHD
jgi:xylulokinase